ncbi:MAG: HEPN domain-containing protein [Deltaproteobacteria bacterium]|nr:HEPN domain-containing protein [Deltaproteobacteria bacterium]
MVNISETANAYFLAAERCEEQKRISQNQVEWLLVPAVTNRAFSIELFLKAILQNDGTSKYGHKLHELFNDLKHERKTQIIEETGLDSELFHKDLTKISNAFVEWRYLYEKEDIQIAWSFLQKLSNAVKKIFENYIKIS